MPPKRSKQQTVEHDSADQSPTADALSPPSNPLEVFSALQDAAASNTIHENVTHVLELMGAAEAITTPPLMRVRFLEFISRHMEKIGDSAALKKIAASLVKIISSDEQTIDPILCAAIYCFQSLGPVSTTDSNLEFLAREAVDILLQITLDHGAFSLTVRKTAIAALDSLTDTAFRCVVTKLLHWLSDDREEDEEEQIRKERQNALSRLSRLAMSPSMKKHWTEEMQIYTLSLIQRIIQMVNVKEFSSLMHVGSFLPLVREKDGLPLLELLISDNQTLSDRTIESLAIVAKHVGTKAEYDLSTYLLRCSVFQQNIPRSGDSAIFLSRVLVLASKTSPPEACEPLIDFVYNQLNLFIGDGRNLNFDFSVFEALLLSFVQLLKKKEVEVLVKSADEPFRNSLSLLQGTLGDISNFSLFAVKKTLQSGQANIQDAELLSCMENCKKIVTAILEKRVPSEAIHESWTEKTKLPVLKRHREETLSRTALPSLRGSASGSPKRQRERRMENTYGRKNRRQ